MNLTHYESFESMASIAEKWNSLLETSVTNSPFLRFEFLKTWWEHKGGGEWPDDSRLFVITAQDGEQLVGIAPLFLTQKADGEYTIYNLGAIEICDLLDIIVFEDRHAVFCAKAAEYLLATISPIGEIRLVNLPSTTATAELFKGVLTKAGFLTELSVYQPSPTIHLQGDFETYLAGIDKKQRHEIRRKIRRAEESGRGVRWYSIETQSQLEVGMQQFYQLMLNDTDKAIFLTDKMKAQMSAIMQLVFDTGTLKMAFLEADGQPAAAYLMFDYDNKLWVYNSGYDRVYNELSAGWVLLGYLIEWSCQNGRREFDFMRGNEDYKFKFGAVDRPVMQLIAKRN